MRDPVVVVLILATDEKKYLINCIPSVLRQTYRNKEIYVVDNGSCDGSFAYIGEKFPSVKRIRISKPMSYPEAYNRVLNKIKDRDLFLLMNADTVADPRMLHGLVKTYTDHKKEKIGLIQPIILLKDHPKLINTVGNAMHFLGFGYCRDYRAVYKKFKEDKRIVSASGAAMMLSRSYLKEVGMFDPEFVKYCEDQNLSWRGLLRGYLHYCSSNSLLYHRYDFARRKDKFYHAEKNRIMMFLENYSHKTILFLLPLFCVTETMVMFYSFLNGWFLQKLLSYWFVASHIKLIAKKRKLVQRKRKIGDKDLLLLFDAEIRTPLLGGFLIDHLVNPIFQAYYRFLLMVL